MPLSPVRVHADPQTGQLVDTLGARAFTYGTHIYLGSQERPTDLRLIAHEVAHTVQQRGGAKVQYYTPAGSAAFEGEANRVSAAVVHNEPAQVQLRTPGPLIQRLELPGWLRRAGRAIASGARAVVSVAGDLLSAALARAVDFIRERARSIPGYDLLGFILGRDPISQQPVERNAVNLIRALLGLIPGGAQMFENLQQARVIERVFEWVNGELARLNLTWAVIRGAFERFLSSLSLTDLGNLSGVFDRARAIFGPILARILEFARSAGRRILEFIFEGALALGGSAAQRILSIFRRIGATFQLIASDPVRFLRNLLNAVMGGFRQFAANILTHLQRAIFDWLFGALQGAGLQLPARFDLRGIISIVLQVLGLTYPRLRERLVRLIGEPAVRTLEVAFEFLRILVTEGIVAAWRKILEYVGNLADTIIDAIKEWIRNTIITQAIQVLASMLTPVGAIIQAVIKIYNTVMFIIERARQIMAFVESVIDSISNIAQGNISAAVNYVEQTLARILPLVISFLARFIGLGGISDRIRQVIQRIRAPVDRALDRVVNWIVERARALVQRGREAVAAVVSWWRRSRPFRTTDGQSHSISLEGEPPNVRVVVQSDRAYLSDVVNRIQSDTLKTQANAKRNEIEGTIRLLDRAGARGRLDPNTRQPVSDPAEINRLTQQLDTQLAEMAQILAQSGVSGAPNLQLPRPVYRFNFSGGKAQGAEVENLSANRPTGSDPSGSPKGWSYLQHTNQTLGKGPPHFVRMHLISNKLGGPGIASNLVPGSNANNTEEHEPKVEKPIKDLVGHTPMQPNKTAVVWYTVRVTYRSDQRELEPGLLMSDFPAQMTFTANYVADWTNPANRSHRVPVPLGRTTLPIDPPH